MLPESNEEDSDASGVGLVDTPVPVIIVPLGVITLSEGFLFLGYPTVGLGSYVTGFILITLLPLHYDDYGLVLYAFALIPVFRLVNFGFPLLFGSSLFQLPLVYSPILGALLVIERYSDEFEYRYGFFNAFILLPVLIGAGVLFATVEYRILSPDAIVTALTPLQLGIVILVMFGWVSATEELLFRGTLQSILEAQLGIWIGRILSSAAFGLMHAHYGSTLEVFFAFSLGFIYAIAYDWTESLATVIVMHGVLNVFLFAIIPIHGMILDIPI